MRSTPQVNSHRSSIAPSRTISVKKHPEEGIRTASLAASKPVGPLTAGLCDHPSRVGGSQKLDFCYSLYPGESMLSASFSSSSALGRRNPPVVSSVPPAAAAVDRMSKNPGGSSSIGLHSGIEISGKSRGKPPSSVTSTSAQKKQHHFSFQNTREAKLSSSLLEASTPLAGSFTSSRSSCGFSSSALPTRSGTPVQGMEKGKGMGGHKGAAPSKDRARPLTGNSNKRTESEGNDTTCGQIEHPSFMVGVISNARGKMGDNESSPEGGVMVSRTPTMKEGKDIEVPLSTLPLDSRKLQDDGGHPLRGLRSLTSSMLTQTCSNGSAAPLPSYSPPVPSVVLSKKAERGNTPVPQLGLQHPPSLEKGEENHPSISVEREEDSLTIESPTREGSRANTLPFSSLDSPMAISEHTKVERAPAAVLWGSPEWGTRPSRSLERKAEMSSSELEDAKRMDKYLPTSEGTETEESASSLPPPVSSTRSCTEGAKSKKKKKRGVLFSSTNSSSVDSSFSSSLQLSPLLHVEDKKQKMPEVSWNEEKRAEIKNTSSSTPPLTNQPDPPQTEDATKKGEISSVEMSDMNSSSTENVVGSISPVEPNPVTKQKKNKKKKKNAAGNTAATTCSATVLHPEKFAAPEESPPKEKDNPPSAEGRRSTSATKSDSEIIGDLGNIEAAEVVVERDETMKKESVGKETMLNNRANEECSTDTVFSPSDNRSNHDDPLNEGPMRWEACSLQNDSNGVLPPSVTPQPSHHPLPCGSQPSRAPPYLHRRAYPDPMLASGLASHSSSSTASGCTPAGVSQHAGYLSFPPHPNNTKCYPLPNHHHSGSHSGNGFNPVNVAVKMNSSTFGREAVQQGNGHGYSFPPPQHGSAPSQLSMSCSPSSSITAQPMGRIVPSSTTRNSGSLPPPAGYPSHSSSFSTSSSTASPGAVGGPPFSSPPSAMPSSFRPPWPSAAPPAPHFGRNGLSSGGGEIPNGTPGTAGGGMEREYSTPHHRLTSTTTYGSGGTVRPLPSPPGSVQFASGPPGPPIPSTIAQPPPNMNILSGAPTGPQYPRDNSNSNSNFNYSNPGNPNYGGGANGAGYYYSSQPSPFPPQPSPTAAGVSPPYQPSCSPCSRGYSTISSASPSPSAYSNGGFSSPMVPLQGMGTTTGRTSTSVSGAVTHNSGGGSMPTYPPASSPAGPQGGNVSGPSPSFSTMGPSASQAALPQPSLPSPSAPYCYYSRKHSNISPQRFSHQDPHHPSYTGMEVRGNRQENNTNPERAMNRGSGYPNESGLVVPPQQRHLYEPQQARLENGMPPSTGVPPSEVPNASVPYSPSPPSTSCPQQVLQEHSQSSFSGRASNTSFGGYGGGSADGGARSRSMGSNAEGLGGGLPMSFPFPSSVPFPHPRPQAYPSLSPPQTSWHGHQKLMNTSFFPPPSSGAPPYGSHPMDGGTSFSSYGGGMNLPRATSSVQAPSSSIAGQPPSMSSCPSVPALAPQPSSMLPVGGPPTMSSMTPPFHSPATAYGNTTTSDISMKTARSSSSSHTSAPAGATPASHPLGICPMANDPVIAGMPSPSHGATVLRANTNRSSSSLTDTGSSHAPAGTGFFSVSHQGPQGAPPLSYVSSSLLLSPAPSSSEHRKPMESSTGEVRGNTDDSRPASEEAKGPLQRAPAIPFPVPLSAAVPSLVKVSERPLLPPSSSPVSFSSTSLMVADDASGSPPPPALLPATVLRSASKRPQGSLSTFPGAKEGGKGTSTTRPAPLTTGVPATSSDGAASDPFSPLPSNPLSPASSTPGCGRPQPSHSSRSESEKPTGGGLRKGWKGKEKQEGQDAVPGVPPMAHPPISPSRPHPLSSSKKVPSLAESSPKGKPVEEGGVEHPMGEEASSTTRDTPSLAARNARRENDRKQGKCVVNELKTDRTVLHPQQSGNNRTESRTGKKGTAGEEVSLSGLSSSQESELPHELLSARDAALPVKKRGGSGKSLPQSDIHTRSMTTPTSAVGTGVPKASPNGGSLNFTRGVGVLPTKRSTDRDNVACSPSEKNNLAPEEVEEKEFSSRLSQGSPEMVERRSDSLATSRHSAAWNASHSGDHREGETSAAEGAAQEDTPNEGTHFVPGTASGVDSPYLPGQFSPVFPPRQSVRVGINSPSVGSSQMAAPSARAASPPSLFGSENPIPGVKWGATSAWKSTHSSPIRSCTTSSLKKGFPIRGGLPPELEHSSRTRIESSVKYNGGSTRDRSLLGREVVCETQEGGPFQDYQRTLEKNPSLLTAPPPQEQELHPSVQSESKERTPIPKTPRIDSFAPFTPEVHPELARLVEEEVLRYLLPTAEGLRIRRFHLDAVAYALAEAIMHVGPSTRGRGVSGGNSHLTSTHVPGSSAINSGGPMMGGSISSNGANNGMNTTHMNPTFSNNGGNLHNLSNGCFGQIRMYIFGSVNMRTVLPDGDNDVTLEIDGLVTNPEQAHPISPAVLAYAGEAMKHGLEEKKGGVGVPSVSASSASHGDLSKGSGHPSTSSSLSSPFLFTSVLPSTTDSSAGNPEGTLQLTTTAEGQPFLVKPVEISLAAGELLKGVREYLTQRQDNELPGVPRVYVDTLVSAEVQVLKLIINGYRFDVTVGQTGGVNCVQFFHEIDQLIGHQHLLKRTMLLLKAWMCYEARILGGQGGYLGSYTVSVMLISMLNMVEFLEDATEEEQAQAEAKQTDNGATNNKKGEASDSVMTDFMEKSTTSGKESHRSSPNNSRNSIHEREMRNALNDEEEDDEPPTIFFASHVSPLVLFARFLKFYSYFDFANYCVTAFGPLRVTSISKQYPCDLSDLEVPAAKLPSTLGSVETVNKDEIQAEDSAPTTKPDKGVRKEAGNDVPGESPHSAAAHAKLPSKNEEASRQHRIPKADLGHVDVEFLGLTPEGQDAIGHLIRRRQRPLFTVSGVKHLLHAMNIGRQQDRQQRYERCKERCQVPQHYGYPPSGSPPSSFSHPMQGGMGMGHAMSFNGGGGRSGMTIEPHSSSYGYACLYGSSPVPPFAFPYSVGGGVMPPHSSPPSSVSSSLQEPYYYPYSGYPYDPSYPFSSEDQGCCGSASHSNAMGGGFAYPYSPTPPGMDASTHPSMSRGQDHSSMDFSPLHGTSPSPMSSGLPSSFHPSYSFVPAAQFHPLHKRGRMEDDVGLLCPSCTTLQFPVRMMNVLDPLRWSSNMTRGVSMNHMQRIILAFREGVKRLQCASAKIETDLWVYDRLQQQQQEYDLAQEAEAGEKAAPEEEEDRHSLPESGHCFLGSHPHFGEDEDHEDAASHPSAGGVTTNSRGGSKYPSRYDYLAEGGPDLEEAAASLLPCSGYPSPYSLCTAGEAAVLQYLFGETIFTIQKFSESNFPWQGSGPTFGPRCAYPSPGCSHSTIFCTQGFISKMCEPQCCIDPPWVPSPTENEMAELRNLGCLGDLMIPESAHASHHENGEEERMIEMEHPRKERMPKEASQGIGLFSYYAASERTKMSATVIPPSTTAVDGCGTTELGDRNLSSNPTVVSRGMPKRHSSATDGRHGGVFFPTPHSSEYSTSLPRSSGLPPYPSPSSNEVGRGRTYHTAGHPFPYHHPNSSGSSSSTTSSSNSSYSGPLSHPHGSSKKRPITNSEEVWKRGTSFKSVGSPPLMRGAVPRMEYSGVPGNTIHHASAPPWRRDAPAPPYSEVNGEDADSPFSSTAPPFSRPSSFPPPADMPLEVTPSISHSSPSNTASSAGRLGEIQGNVKESSSVGMGLHHSHREGGGGSWRGTQESTPRRQAGADRSKNGERPNSPVIRNAATSAVTTSSCTTTSTIDGRS